MITKEQAQAYLQSIGADNIPDFILDAWVEQLNSINDCLAANYGTAVATLIQSYLLGLFVVGSGDKYVSSQTAPSGASQSFRYKSVADAWRTQYNALRALDKAGCATPLIPADPTGANCALFVGKGNRCKC